MARNRTRNGDRGDDRLLGGVFADTLAGLLGADLLIGRRGEDRLDGGRGDDVLKGGVAADTLIGGAGRDRLLGGRDDDRILGGSGSDTLEGGVGDDRLVGGGGKDRLVGGAGDDTLTGGGGRDKLDGRGGRDVLRGDVGADTLMGGGGNDRLFGGSGNDRLFGGNGRDTIKGAAGDDRLIGGAKDDRLLGGADDDTLKGGGGRDNLMAGAGADRLVGGGGSDVANGGRGRDLLFGGRGSDNLKGGGGRDSLVGGSGSDELSGGGGADTLRGGAGDDTLAGGRGADHFLFRAADGASTDLVQDFTPGVDLIPLSGFAGIADFGDVQITDSAAGAVVDLGGGQRIVLAGVERTDLSAADFNLSAPNPDPDPDPDPTDPPTTPVVPGTAGQDNLRGGAQTELVRGLGDDDVLRTSGGRDTLFGGDGADVFAISLEGDALDATPDVVADFLYALGDVIGLEEALQRVAFEKIDDVVKATPLLDGTMISVNRGAGFMDVLFLEGPDVRFTTDELASYGFLAPPRNGAVFDDNPYGFTNTSNTTADPDATPDGRHVAFVNKDNIDGLVGDPRADATDEFGSLDFLTTMDVFVRNVDTGVTQRVSSAADGGVLRTLDGSLANSMSPAISADGRFVAYATDGVAVPGDDIPGGDVYVRDMRLGTAPELVSRAFDDFSLGGVPLGSSGQTTSAGVIAISDDGQRIAFLSENAHFFDGAVGNLDMIDLNLELDVYLYDRPSGVTHLVSGITTENAFGGPDFFDAAGGVRDPYPTFDQFDFVKDATVTMSGDGRFVAFVTSAQIDPADTDAEEDVYLRDIDGQRTLLLSGGFDGEAFAPSISRDGSRIAFTLDTDPSGDDFNGGFETVVVEVSLDTFEVGANLGIPHDPNRGELHAVLSPDGERVAFTSFDPNDFNFDPRLEIVKIATGESRTFDYLANTSIDIDFLGPGFAAYDLFNDGVALRRLSEQVSISEELGDAIETERFDFPSDELL